MTPSGMLLSIITRLLNFNRLINLTVTAYVVNPQKFLHEIKFTVSRILCEEVC